MSIIFQIALLTTLLLVVESSDGALNYEFSTSLHAKYNLYWNRPADGKICMAVQVETLGWVGLGFSPNGGMIDSDIMMAWVIDGQVTLTDRYAVSESLPELDLQQDFELIEGYEEDGKTTIEFCRKLETCDEDYRDRNIVAGTTKVVFSWNNNDPNPNPLQHGTRGTMNVNFIGAPRPEFYPSDLPADTQILEFKMGNITIPHDTDTTYWCRTLRLDQPATKHHVIQIGSYLDSRTFSYLHHVVLYQCMGTIAEMDGNCIGSNGLIATHQLDLKCQGTVISTWAVGGSDVLIPQAVGLPIGPDEEYDTVLLVNHYNNPQLDEGIVDNSGFIWYYTAELRTHDLGIFYLGHTFTENLSIPPKTDNFLVQVYCPNECTSSWPHDLNIIASLLHTHYTGFAIWTQLIRDNKEIELIDSNQNYDPDFQEYLYFEDPIVVKPGDEFIVNCLYQTQDKDNFTFGGRSAKEEMCFNFLYYYPRVTQSYCSMNYLKETAFNSALESLQCNNVDVDGATTYEELENRAMNIDWTEKISNTLEIAQSVNPNGVLVFCNYNSFIVNIPKPGVDYEVFHNRYDTCGRYNGTYYPGGEDANYYYDCDTNQPYFDPIGPTDSAAGLTLLPVVMWMLVTAVLSLF
ncbi:DBH-like monooxygenase protein 1 precursor [Oopsacas minuta]|uniref:DBH-like monooxygenase protein 1 n=1 Tax=Oopsacas minuta TaxID=111878 RepID=A0AAV7JU72_9METZ|nr:DBH-like monooxygenase protein 1 precursor [Oopsacas minuta]